MLLLTKSLLFMVSQFRGFVLGDDLMVIKLMMVVRSLISPSIALLPFSIGKHFYSAV